MSALEEEGTVRACFNERKKRLSRKGCRVVDLKTFDFQAPRFYEKRGYVAFGELTKVSAEHTVDFFSKYLENCRDEA